MRTVFIWSPGLTDCLVTFKNILVTDGKRLTRRKRHFARMIGALLQFCHEEVPFSCLFASIRGFRLLRNNLRAPISELLIVSRVNFKQIEKKKSKTYTVARKFGALFDLPNEQPFFVHDSTFRRNCYSCVSDWALFEHNVQLYSDTSFVFE